MISPIVEDIELIMLMFLTKIMLSNNDDQSIKKSEQIK